MRWVLSSILRLLGFGLIWLGLSDASSDYFGYGAVSVVVATALSFALLPPAKPRIAQWPKRIWGTVLLAGWFLQQSVLGGIDVARRAVTRRIDVAPEIVGVTVALPEGPGRELCYLLMNLLPGSMVQRVRETDEQTVVEIHTLSMDLEPGRQWQKLQARVQQALQSGWLEESTAL